MGEGPEKMEPGVRGATDPLKWLRLKLVTQFEDHEQDEWLRIDGKRLKEPEHHG